jgi:hypothetical protein
MGHPASSVGRGGHLGLKSGKASWEELTKLTKPGFVSFVSESEEQVSLFKDWVSGVLSVLSVPPRGLSLFFERSRSM